MFCERIEDPEDPNAVTVFTVRKAGNVRVGSRANTSSNINGVIATLRSLPLKMLKVDDDAQGNTSPVRPPQNTPLH